MGSNVSRSVIYVGGLLLLSLAAISCQQQVAVPTAKPAAMIPTAAAPALAPTSTTAPAAAPTVATKSTVAPAQPAASPTAVRAAKAPRVGKAVWGHPVDFGSNDPYLQPSSGESLYLSSVFESLMQYDFDGKLVPALALSYKWLDDKTIEYQLRKGVKFHNGDPFTAADVQFTFQKAMSPHAAKSGRDAYLKKVDRVDVVDDYTVRFNLKEMYPVFPLAITPIDAPGAFMIHPKAYSEKNGNEYFERNPVGTGPFKFKSRMLGSSLTVEAFDDWWGPEPWDLAPTVRELEFRLLKESQTRVASLLAGELDIIDGLDFASVDTIQAKQGYKVMVLPALQLTVISMNTALEKVPGTDKSNPFRDKRVRQAMRYAVDSEAIVKSIMRGFVPKLEGPWAPPALGAHPERLTTKYAYNPDKARQLLKEANYPSDLEVPHLTAGAGRPGREEANVAADGFLRAVGMNVKTRVVDSGVVLESRLKQTLWAMSAWSVQYPFLDPIRSSGLTTKDGMAPAYTIEGDKALDELVAATQRVNDAKERDERWFKVYEYVNDNASWTPLTVMAGTFGLSPRVAFRTIPFSEPLFPHRVTWQSGYPK